VGWAFGNGRVPLGDSILCVSGRLSFELVQKAAVAGCPVLAGVGAPSSLAISLAEAQGVTLCGFVRSDRVVVYAHAERVESGARPG
jgi:FdhD protein